MAEPKSSASGPEDDLDILGEADPDLEVEADLRAEADVAAGRVVSHEAVKRWLLSWGSDNPLSRPKCGE